MEGRGAGNLRRKVHTKDLSCHLLKWKQKRPGVFGKSLARKLRRNRKQPASQLRKIRRRLPTERSLFVKVISDFSIIIFRWAKPKDIILHLCWNCFWRSNMCVNYLPYWCLVSTCYSSSWWLGFVFILEKLLDTLAEINQKLLKIVKMYFIQNLSTFIYLVTFYLKTKL